MTPDEYKDKAAPEFPEPDFGTMYRSECETVLAAIDAGLVPDSMLDRIAAAASFALQERLPADPIPDRPF